MHFCRVVAMMMGTAAAAAAGTLFDVTAQATQTLNPGDALHFLISNLSLPNLTGIQFQFVSQPLNAAAQFEAELWSPDGSVAVPFAGISTRTAQFSGSHYSGPVTSIFGSVALSATTSQELFQNTRAALVLHNVAGTVSSGLPGYTLKGDLFVSLVNNGQLAGAVVNKVLYEDPPAPQVPETNSGFLVAGAGLLLCVFSRVMKRISKRRIQ